MTHLVLVAVALLVVLLVAVVLLTRARPATPVTPSRAAAPPNAGGVASEMATPAYRGVQSLAELEADVARSPSNVASLSRLARAYFEKGDFDRAQRSYRMLLLQDLEHAVISKAEVFCRLGEISERMGDRAKAIAMLHRAAEIEPGLAEARELLRRLEG